MKAFQCVEGLAIALFLLAGTAQAQTVTERTLLFEDSYHLKFPMPYTGLEQDFGSMDCSYYIERRSDGLELYCRDCRYFSPVPSSEVQRHVLCSTNPEDITL